MYTFVRITDKPSVHKELNPALWDGNKLKPYVRKKIKLIVDKFTEYVAEYGINLYVKDIYLLGSNANYNYNKYSDIDVHIIADYKNMNNKKDYLSKLYLAYKTMFNNSYDFEIEKIPVEVYVENSKNITNVSNGVFSFNEGWIKEPTLNTVSYDKKEFASRYKEAESKASGLLKSESKKEIDKFLSSVYEKRVNGVKANGEFDIDNLVYKELRDKRYIQRLHNRIIELEEDEVNN